MCSDELGQGIGGIVQRVRLCPVDGARRQQGRQHAEVSVWKHDAAEEGGATVSNGASNAQPIRVVQSFFGREGGNPPLRVLLGCHATRGGRAPTVDTSCAVRTERVAVHCLMTHQ
jgi:hypothetical protein